MILSNDCRHTTTLRELALLFLRLGATAFGGPAAHIAMMEDEVVRRKSWITRAQFLDLLAIVNLIPGPNSTEMAIHIGYARAGFKGLVIAGLSFIMPATLIVTIIAWAYVKFGNLPVADALLYGIKPVVIALIFQVGWRLGQSAVKSVFLGMVGVAASVIYLGGASELLVLALAAVVSPIFKMFRNRMRNDNLPLVTLAPFVPGGLTLKQCAALGTAPLLVAATPIAAPLWPIFIVFLKAGALLFGSGYVLLAFLRSDLVEHLGWLTEGQLLDAVAVGQITPGPVFTTATFIGYLLCGVPGAAVATVGIFLPAFFFVALSAPFVPHLRRSKTAADMLDGLNVASLALLIVTGMRLSYVALIDWPTLILAAGCLLLLLRFKLSASWLMLGGGLLGIASQIVLQ